MNPQITKRDSGKQNADEKKVNYSFMTILRGCITSSGAFVVAVTLGACANTPVVEAPSIDQSLGARALKNLPRKQGDLVPVTIYEFRSTVSEIPVRGATDIFKTALVQSGQFRVVERARLNEGVIREKQLNSSGLTSGNSGREALTAAKYIFEGAITEANAGETQRAGAIRIGGAEIGGSSNRDVIGIDVRVVDVGTSEVVGVVTVKKAMKSDSSNVSGLGNLIGSVLSRAGKNTAYVPDVQIQQQRKESLDGALRAVIDEAVIELSRRFAL